MRKKRSSIQNANIRLKVSLLEPQRQKEHKVSRREVTSVFGFASFLRMLLNSKACILVPYFLICFRHTSRTIDMAVYRSAAFVPNIA